MISLIAIHFKDGGGMKKRNIKNRFMTDSFVCFQAISNIMQIFISE